MLKNELPVIDVDVSVQSFIFDIGESSLTVEQRIEDIVVGRMLNAFMKLENNQNTCSHRSGCIAGLIIHALGLARSINSYNTL